MRATTSLPDPVGPRISTAMSDFAAVRIHSNTISIFSSRPIISRKRWTDGAWSSVLIAARLSRNLSSRAAESSFSRRAALQRGGVVAYEAPGGNRLIEIAQLDASFQSHLASDGRGT